MILTFPTWKQKKLFEFHKKISVLTEEHPTAAHNKPAFTRAVKMYGKL